MGAGRVGERPASSRSISGSVDIRRFSNLHNDRDWTRDRTLEAYGKHYTVAFPLEEYESGRPRIVSPLYERLKEHRAVFGSKLGWERANWFAPEGVEPRDIYSFGRGNWFDHVGAEHAAARERVALFDQSSFAKFEMRGRDAEKALSWIAANDVTKPPGRLVYTQMLNSRGGIECDLTVARLAADHYYIVTGTGFRTHDFAWIRQNIPDGLDAELSDVTEEFGTLSLFGPRARDVLAAVTDADVSNEALSLRRRPRDRHRRRQRPRAPRHLCRRARLGAAHADRRHRHGLRRADGGGRAARHRARRLSRASNRFGWKRAIAPGAPTSRPTTIPSRPGSAGR